MSEADLDRGCGLLLGLAAGDRNGGPIQMALALAESLATCRTHDPVAVLAAYHSWWSDGHGIDAWDTGPIAEQALRRAPSVRRVADIDAHARALDASLRGQTAGANAVHRVPPLALAAWLTDAELATQARQESRLTHWSPVSQHTCAVAAMLCRRLVRGEAWAAAVRGVRDEADELAPDLPAVRAALHAEARRAQGGGTGDGGLGGLDSGGFCVEVLRASLWFVGRASTFEEALRPALRFAGPNNYCPVLVGALAGARFGGRATLAHLAHCRPGVAERCRRAAAALLEPVVAAEAAQGEDEQTSSQGLREDQKRKRGGGEEADLHRRCAN